MKVLVCRQRKLWLVGVPLISTSGGALPEVVGNAGLIVPPADADALAREIVFLFKNPEQRKKWVRQE